MFGRWLWLGYARCAWELVALAARLARLLVSALLRLILGLFHASLSLMVMLFLLPSPDDPFFWLLLDD